MLGAAVQKPSRGLTSEVQGGLIVLSQESKDGVLVPLSVRSDPAGDGSYGAPRGTRVHRGIDFRCVPEQAVFGGITGKVTKHGYCYGNDLSWRYVQVTDWQGLHHRFFYVDPILPIGEVVTPETRIGVAQDITKRYPNQGMLPHVHYEVMNQDGRCIDPASCSA